MWLGSRLERAQDRQQLAAVVGLDRARDRLRQVAERPRAPVHAETGPGAFLAVAEAAAVRVDDQPAVCCAAEAVGPLLGWQDLSSFELGEVPAGRAARGPGRALAAPSCRRAGRRRLPLLGRPSAGRPWCRQVCEGERVTGQSARLRAARSWELGQELHAQDLTPAKRSASSTRSNFLKLAAG